MTGISLLITFAAWGQTNNPLFNIQELNGIFNSSMTTGRPQDDFTFKYDSKTKIASAYANGKIFFTVKVETWGPNQDDDKYPTVTYTKDGESYNICEFSSVIRKVDGRFEIYCPAHGQGNDHVDDLVYLILGRKK